MIKIENTDTYGWEAAFRGLRNPMNSWARSDSHWGLEHHDDGIYAVGEKDLDLALRMNVTTEQSKYRRMIIVTCDITAPIYWWAEMDTYKVGTVRNSCSFMHKGVSKPFAITDFSVKDKLIYECLQEIPTKQYALIYPYETEEYRVYTDERGRKYDVYKNGRIFCEEFEYTDTWGTGRARKFDRRELTPDASRDSYYGVYLSGRGRKRFALHRLVAEMWCEKPNVSYTQVNHIDGNKGNNCAENLEWVTPSENMQKAVAIGLYDNLDSYHRKYMYWKHISEHIPDDQRVSFYNDCNNMQAKELVEKYGLTTADSYNLKHSGFRRNIDLFMECDVWSGIIDTLNSIRELYLEAPDNQTFQALRCLIPQGYNQRATMMFNYEVLSQIYRQRKNHRIDEWREFCAWIETLPNAELIIGKAGKADDNN